MCVYLHAFYFLGLFIYYSTYIATQLLESFEMPQSSFLIGFQSTGCLSNCSSK